MRVRNQWRNQNFGSTGAPVAGATVVDGATAGVVDGATAGVAGTLATLVVGVGVATGDFVSISSTNN